MKKLKFALALVLLAALCLSLVGCGLSEEDAVGTWGGTYTYNGSTITVVFQLFEDGTYLKMVERDGNMQDLDMGTYTVEKGLLGTKVVLESDIDSATTTYEYKNGGLYNNNHKFTKA